MRSFFYSNNYDDVFDWKTDPFFMSSLTLNIFTLLWTRGLYVKFQSSIEKTNNPEKSKINKFDMRKWNKNSKNLNKYFPKS
jgi:hypothetical protein